MTDLIILLFFIVISIVTLITKIPLLKILFGCVDLIIASTMIYDITIINILLALLGVLNIYGSYMDLKR